MKRYPELEINLNNLSNNIKQIKKRCDKYNIKLAGVIKGATGIKEIAETFDKENVEFIASSRIEQLIPLKGKVKAKIMMIRIPMLSEVEDIVKYTDISLNSEIEVLKKLNSEAKKQGKTHEIILMQDLGDLREGFFKKEDIINASLLIENELNNLKLVGIGTNLGCYGSIVPTREKLEELVTIAEIIEEKINRKLDYISGGATTSIPRVLDGDIPKRINLLRVGEGILLGKDLQDLWGYDMSYMKKVFKLNAEIIEVKDKPTYPIGEIFVDAFGNKPTYKDEGIRKRALIALGKVDYAFIDDLIINLDGAKIIGASSDHTIIDIEDCDKKIKPGDIISFDLTYSTMVYVTNSNNINKVFIK